jgi:hypothetical protein
VDGVTERGRGRVRSSLQQQFGDGAAPAANSEIQCRFAPRDLLQPVGRDALARRDALRSVHVGVRIGALI